MGSYSTPPSHPVALARHSSTVPVDAKCLPRKSQNCCLSACAVLALSQGNGGEVQFRETGEAKVKYRVVLEPQEEGGYTVFVPTLPGCVSQGESAKEAMANIREAIEVYLESLRERGIPLPRVEEREVAV